MGPAGWRGILPGAGGTTRPTRWDEPAGGSLTIVGRVSRQCRYGL